MISGHEFLYRVNYQGKSVYCGYSVETATKKYYELEPEATPENPVEWWMIVAQDNPLNQITKKLLRRAPGEDPLTETLADA